MAEIHFDPEEVGVALWYDLYRAHWVSIREISKKWARLFFLLLSFSKNLKLVNPK
jgi:hypothetical protein